MLAGRAQAAACLLLALVGLAEAVKEASFQLSIVHLNDNRERLQGGFRLLHAPAAAAPHKAPLPHSQPSSSQYPERYAQSCPLQMPASNRQT